MSTDATIIQFPTRQAPAPRRAHTVGDQYEATRDLDVAQIAKLVRKDLKAAQKDTGNPVPADSKISVRISRYSMGQSINVTITLPDRPTRVPGSDPRSCSPGHLSSCTMTTEAVAIHDAADVIVQAYNYDNSDSLTDYSENKYFGFVWVNGTPD